MNKNNIMEIIKYLAVTGNILFILWILYNGINEGFQANLIEKISYFSLIGLLCVNSFLILKYIKKN